MDWIVTYKNQQGRHKTLVVDAPDRSQAFAELERRGIQAVRVEPSDGRKPRRPRPSRVTGRAFRFASVVIAVIIIATAAIVFFAALRGGGDAGDETAVPRHGQVLQAAPTATSASTVGGTAVEGIDGQFSVHGGADIERDDDNDEDSDDGHDAEVAAESSPDSESLVTKRRRIFNSGTDELIALATCAPEGGSIPPLPMMSRQDTDRFIESLSEPIEIEEDDTPEIRAVKERVSTLRAEIVEVLKANPDMELREILNEHRDIFNNNSRLYAEAKQEYDALLEEGDVEGARQYREGLNEAFSQMGIKQIENEESDDDESDEEEED